MTLLFAIWLSVVQESLTTPPNETGITILPVEEPGYPIIQVEWLCERDRWEI